MLSTLQWSFRRERLTELREVLGLSLNSFGRRIGRSGMSIANWENGKTHPTIQDLIDIANAYHVDPTSFLTRDSSTRHRTPR